MTGEELKKFRAEIEKDKAKFRQYVDNVKALVGKVPYPIALRLSEDWKKHELTAQMLVDMSEHERIMWVFVHGQEWLRETESVKVESPMQSIKAPRIPIGTNNG